MNHIKNSSEIFNLSLLKEALDYGITSTGNVFNTLVNKKRTSP